MEGIVLPLMDIIVTDQFHVYLSFHIVILILQLQH